MNEKYEELSSLCLCGYSKKETKFENNCWTYFWKNNLDMLLSLEYKGKLSYIDRQKEMITEFQNFRLTWENYAKKNKMQLILVSDNNAFDGGLINAMILKYIPDDLPVPFTVKSKNLKASLKLQV